MQTAIETPQERAVMPEARPADRPADIVLVLVLSALSFLVVLRPVFGLPIRGSRCHGFGLAGSR